MYAPTSTEDIVNVGTSESVDLLVFGLGRYGLSGAPMVGMDGGVVGIVWGIIYNPSHVLVSLPYLAPLGEVYRSGARGLSPYQF